MRNLENGLTVETAKDNRKWDHVVIPSQGWFDFELRETW